MSIPDWFLDLITSDITTNVIGVIIIGILLFFIRTYKELKEEMIKTKDAHIQMLQEEKDFYKDLTSSRLLNHQKNQIREFEHIVKTLSNTNSELQNEISARDKQIEEYKSNNQDVELLVLKRNELQEQFSNFQTLIGAFEAFVKRTERYIDEGLLGLTPFDEDLPTIWSKFSDQVKRIRGSSDEITNIIGDEWLNPQAKQQLEETEKLLSESSSDKETSRYEKIIFDLQTELKVLDRRIWMTKKGINAPDPKIVQNCIELVERMENECKQINQIISILKMLDSNFQE